MLNQIAPSRAIDAPVVANLIVRRTIAVWRHAARQSLRPTLLLRRLRTATHVAINLVVSTAMGTTLRTTVRSVLSGNTDSVLTGSLANMLRLRRLVSVLDSLFLLRCRMLSPLLLVVEALVLLNE
jgi:hypothetical protein